MLSSLWWEPVLLPDSWRCVMRLLPPGGQSLKLEINSGYSLLAC